MWYYSEKRKSSRGKHQEAYRPQRNLSGGTSILWGNPYPGWGCPYQRLGYPKKGSGTRDWGNPLVNKQTENITFPHPRNAGGMRNPAEVKRNERLCLTSWPRAFNSCPIQLVEIMCDFPCVGITNILSQLTTVKNAKRNKGKNVSMSYLFVLPFELEVV